MSKPTDLRQALYRARATMAEGSLTASEWAGSSNTSNALLGFQKIDRIMQSGVEDADKALIEHEQTNIFKIWVCSVCGNHKLPSPDPDGQEETPKCGHWMSISDPTPAFVDEKEMELVTVERID